VKKFPSSRLRTRSGRTERAAPTLVLPTGSSRSRSASPIPKRLHRHLCAIFTTIPDTVSLRRAAQKRALHTQPTARAGSLSQLRVFSCELSHASAESRHTIVAISSSFPGHISRKPSDSFRRNVFVMFENYRYRRRRSQRRQVEVLCSSCEKHSS
jgi:hypothetical protein